MLEDMLNARLSKLVKEDGLKRVLKKLCTYYPMLKLMLN
jgi:hypothetical protein